MKANPAQKSQMGNEKTSDIFNISLTFTQNVAIFIRISILIRPE